MITYRWATQADAPFVAWGVCCALHTHPTSEKLDFIARNVCSRGPEILYSYCNALLAFDGACPVGLCLSYDGKGYHERRLTTFALFGEDSEADDEEIQDMDLENAEDETCAGEYYIDSLAVLPEYRGQGIAKKLMLLHIEHAAILGLPIATLLVDPDNPPALRLYESLGFKYHSDCYAFGMTFAKMAKTLEKQ